MKRKTRETPKEPGATQSPDLMKENRFFQDLPPDIQMVILQVVKFRLSRNPWPEDLGLLDLDDLLDEAADDVINRSNWKRTISEWLRFAEKGR